MEINRGPGSPTTAAPADSAGATEATPDTAASEAPRADGRPPDRADSRVAVSPRITGGESRALPNGTPAPSGGLTAGALQFANPPSGRTSHRVDVEYVNDSFPGSVPRALPQEHQNGTGRADDDGWTAEMSTNYTATREDRQFTLGARWQMVTERGSVNPDESYGGRRQDITEVAGQVNRLRSFGDGQLVTGIGGGLQRIGPQGLDELQGWFHEQHRGRTAETGLQTNYTSDSVRNIPIATGGVGVMREINHERFGHLLDLTAHGEATIPLGEGMATVRARAGFEVRPIERLELSGGVNVTGAYAFGDDLEFINPNGVRLGGELGAQFEVLRNASMFARVDVGGIRDEPVFRVGITIGGGEKPWLRSLF